MAKKYGLSLFIFRRDLRVDDNTALNIAMENSDEVIPCFIFDPRLADEKRKNFNHNAFHFLLECLDDLKLQLDSKYGKLFFFSGLPENIISDLKKKHEIDAVFFNKDYTPFSKKRDSTILESCESSGIDFVSYHDALLHEPGKVLTNEGKSYSVFSQFFKKASKRDIPLPEMQEGGNFYSGDLDLALIEFSDLSIDRNPSLFAKGGRTNALSILQDINEFRNYDNERDYPSIKSTTGLSAHNKLGTVSIREFYHYVRNELDEGHTLINELHWRDFFTHIAVAHPYVFKGAFKRKFDSLSWSDDKKLFDAWCKGQTGFPIVDAGMRELNTTGYMHNRVRMIVASFLVKDLHIDWKWGERYFASKLVDYDPCVNNGNWQWAASTGADSQPYFRIFNPWLQQKKFDPDCAYIKKWIPELSEVEPKAIHSLEKGQQLLGVDYPQTIISHKDEREKALTMFKSIS
ncbi:cryptochrome/photolyase family protein [Methanolobus bombayensis]|uniref:cryptochrome/photolyase family protein n=1 Tax=Methanolobus bombayensis TaxID=38023 RepID=UPI001AE222D5|nr:deoxyribodipyrimidine photo-lyase [Methanolobus bombayensis]MBP1908246.1 deoxyribodipyrimidine photo-lyase [Methanolobus bombayensis]